MGPTSLSIFAIFKMSHILYFPIVTVDILQVFTKNSKTQVHRYAYSLSTLIQSTVVRYHNRIKLPNNPSLGHPGISSLHFCLTNTTGTVLEI